MKKIKYLIFGLLLGCLGLTSFSSATNYTCSDVFIDVSENSYFILNSFDGDGYFILDNNNGSYLGYGISVPQISLLPNGNLASSFPIILSPGNYTLSCTALDSLSFSVVPVSSISDCPSVPSGGSCSNTGTVSDLTNRVLLYTGSVSLNNSSYTNVFNYGSNGAGTYCVKLSSSNQQTLTFGFANGGATAPSNLYTLYNDQYGQVVCLYGNKPYFNAKLNSSSNTVSYEVYKLSDLYSSNVCLENECPSCPSCPSCEDCSQYQEDLLSCQEDNESLTNMNTSLNDQLNQCLVNGGTGCDPEVDSGCVEGATVYSLFWNQMGSDFSLPITNNIFLLSGMKAYSESGVVALSYIDSPIVDYSMDSESGDRLTSLVVGIFEILSGIIFVLVAGYYFKKFLSYVLFPYKK